MSLDNKREVPMGKDSPIDLLDDLSLGTSKVPAKKKAPAKKTTSKPTQAGVLESGRSDAGQVLDSLVSCNQQPSPPQNPALVSNVDLPPQQIDADQHEDKNTVLKQWELDQVANRGMRDKYAHKAYELSAGCIAFWIVMIGAQGITKGVTGVSMLSDAVIMSTTAAVTVNVLAAFLGVIRGLFPNDSNEKTEKGKKSKGKGGA